MNRRVPIALLVLALCTGFGAAAEAKKKGGSSKTFEEQKAVNVAIPPDAATGPSTPLTSTITVPKKFKKKVVGDVNVTGFQTTGTAASAADDLSAQLTAPGGRTVLLLVGIGDQSIGPLTMDDDTATSICNVAAPPCADPNQTLNRPFAGTANLLRNNLGLKSGLLSNFNGVKMRGTWTLAVYDLSSATNSTLNSWGLRIKPAKPIPE